MSTQRIHIVPSACVSVLWLLNTYYIVYFSNYNCSKR